MAALQQKMSEIIGPESAWVNGWIRPDRFEMPVHAWLWSGVKENNTIVFSVAEVYQDGIALKIGVIQFVDEVLLADS